MRSYSCKILRLLSLIPFTLLFWPLSGCTWIMVDHYFAPTTKDKSEQPYEYTTCDITFFSTGPAETIKIEVDEIAITIYQRGRGRKLSHVSIGPLYFPVIPIFPINWFKADRDEPLNLIFDIATKGNHKANWQIKDSILVTPEGNIVQPEAYTARFKQTVIVDESTMVELEPSAFYELRYPLTAKTISAFHLSLKGFSINDKIISLPTVEFRQTASWKMCGGP